MKARYRAVLLPAVLHAAEYRHNVVAYGATAGGAAAAIAAARARIALVGRHYGQTIAWTFEPSVAERVFNDCLREAEVAVYFEQPIAGVDRRRAAIERLRTASGSTFGAEVFIDGS